KSLPLAFYLEELSGGSANANILLLIRADMVNFEVRRVLVDPGSSVDIMYARLHRQSSQLGEEAQDNVTTTRTKRELGGS
ncbi:hypothetical protein A2U01_0067350, partial [Trifolium medium]|nr:hypothetical protein [Trifolium medium]